jgi:hypothetical protein
MANMVRGFRRIGWVVSVPVAILIVLLYFDSTKEFSVVGYEVSSGEPDYDALANKVRREHGSPADPATPPDENVIEMPELGYAHFSKDVPLDVANKIVVDFAQNGLKKREALTPGKLGDTALKAGLKPRKSPRVVLDDNGNPIPPPPQGYKIDEPPQYSDVPAGAKVVGDIFDQIRS